MAPQAIKDPCETQENSQAEITDKPNMSSKKLPLGAPSKFCGVCGDKAYGFNFNAITCESCKAFFRRNALASKSFQCSFNEDCSITVLTRRFCQKCRLDKCFAIGMDKECIMSEEDKAQKRLKIAENKAKKRLKERAGDDEVSSSKIVKRKENEDSNNSWVVYVSSKVIKREDSDDSGNSWCMNEKEKSSASIDQSNESPNDILINNGKSDIQCTSQLSNCPQPPISVIRNSDSFDSNITSSSMTINEDIHASNFLAKKPTSVYDISYGNYEEDISGSSQTPLSYDMNYTQEVHNLIESSNTIANEAISADRSNKFILSPDIQSQDVQEEDHVVLRSILTTPTLNNELPAKPFAPHIPEQQMCDAAANASRSSVPSKADVARDVLQDVESIYRIPEQNHSIENILCEAIKLEFEAYTSLAQINSSSRELNDAERAKLNELIVANKALSTPLDEDPVISLVSDEYRFKPQQGQNNLTLLGIINLTAVAIRRLIKMAKKINAFKNMCEEDQVALLKGGCTEMMILRSTMTYDCARNTWKIPHSQESMSNIKAEVLKLAKGNIYEEHERFIRTFDPKWRMDENIILIMCAIVLFTPDRQRVVHSDVIKLEQNSYYYLLRRYLESIYPGCEAKSTFLKLIQKIMELHKLADDVIGVYLDVNPSHVEPLLIEIFDLKQH